MAQISLVLGGAASGKSVFAERLAAASGRPLTYIATAQAHDGEMAAKIEAHRARRGNTWTTVEAPHDLPHALGAVRPGRQVLLDCVTLWLSNRLGAGADPATLAGPLVTALSRCASPVVVVSNELGLGLVPEHPLGRVFRDLQGTVNQAIAAQADTVVFVAAGLPLVLKGTLPTGGAP